MQQFFGLIHRLLCQDAAAVRRGLALRTYKVQPFSPASGVLQWVDDTQPMMDYLMGAGRDRNGGAHGRQAAGGAGGKGGHGKPAAVLLGCKP